MSRPLPPAEIEFPGSDSFLDVVTNIVGILIILVIVVGVRSKKASYDAATAAHVGSESTAAHETTLALGADVSRLSSEIENVRAVTGQRFAERAQLATIVAALEKDLTMRRDTLDVDARRDYDLRTELSTARDELNRLQKQREEVEQQPGPSKKIESYPAISKTVDTKEAHFQLKAGRVVFIPLDNLLEKFHAEARQKASRLREMSETTEIVGPVGGFNLRYTLERIDVPFDTKMPSRAGTVVQLNRWELIPTAARLGETAEEALAPKSLFRAKLELINPLQQTITVWVYPDSFEEFRRIRKELYLLGYSVAGRPLPEGTPIGGSPHGSRSAAE